MIVGHDGGLDVSNDGGLTWDFHNDIAVGQFYQVSADMRRPYYVCGGLQDNNAWCGPSALRSTAGAVNTDWFTVGGGDGFYTRQDPDRLGHRLRRIAGRQHEPPRYAQRHAEEHPAQRRRRTRRGNRGGSGNSGAPRQRLRSGNSDRRDGPGGADSGHSGGSGGKRGRRGTRRGGAGGRRRGGAPNVINAPPNVDTLRFYWNAPFEISPHNPAVVYMAGQYFFKSNNRGDTWWMNPTDLSKNINRWAPELSIMGVIGR